MVNIRRPVIQAIIDALKWLDENEPNWKLDEPINRVVFIEDLVGRMAEEKEYDNIKLTELDGGCMDRKTEIEKIYGRKRLTDLAVTDLPIIIEYITIITNENEKPDYSVVPPKIDNG